MSDNELIDVALCVNDPHSGAPTGRVCRADFGHNEVSLDTGFGYDSGNPTFAFLPPHRVRIGRCVYTIHGYRSHVGNWCWDDVRMTRGEAKRLIANLLKRGFTVDEALDATDLVAPTWVTK
jgi:hypothetical protein